jgi:hypothetical protein
LGRVRFFFNTAHFEMAEIAGFLCAWLDRRMQRKRVREPVEASVLEPAI